ncbi:transcriptional regulator with XRE-family HTH domain [Desulfohalotomaculum tongense]|uniref:helix-turn-helix domain-containing protein n=1 Tax=Desulforadius tongensis TaxID=1216062 RepID=UPI00195CDBC7|nr:helix-turn-helix transcriptional regulator [Desulforadius tongensis]MBM7854195.1 transcriptional regulator with XRE-family HTH domain [Desulforadius tongensis]
MFAARLVSLRKKAKFTQKELAAKLNIGRGALSLYEIGQREPDLETLNKIADFFNVSTDYLLGRTNSDTKLNPVYLEIIQEWEKEGGNPEALKKALKDYMKLIRKWQEKGFSPDRIKEIWDKIFEVSNTLNKLG